MKGAAVPSRTYRFAAFELDLHSGELLKEGRRLRLQEQPFQVLQLLLENAGEVVTREELRQKLWLEDTFVDFDHGLNNAVNRLRELLGDSAEKPRYIETLPRRGYRFIAPLGSEAAALPTAEREPPISEHRAGKTWKRAAIAAGILALLGIAGLTYEFTFQRGASVRIQSLAVLPLENLTGDPSQEYLADGLTDALTTELAQIGALRVISRSSVIRFKGTRKPVNLIGRELSVDGVVAGAVLRSGDKVRIDAQMIEAAHDRHIWARSYERDSREMVGLASDVARSMAQEIGLKLTPLEQARLASGHTVKPEAYETYLRGRFHSIRENDEDNLAAIELLERTVALDPTFALAYAELAHAYAVRFFYFAPQEKQWEEKAFVAVERAVSLNPDLPEAHLARGVLLWTPANHFPHEEAIQEFRKAVAANPNLDEARHQLGLVYLHIGLFDKGRDELQKAVAINPSNTLARYRIGVVLHHQGKYDQALAVLRTIPPQFNTAVVARQTAWTLFNLRRSAEARSLIEECLKRDPRDTGGQFASMQAMFHAAAGESKSAETKIRAAVGQRQGFGHFHHTAYNIAVAYALLNKSGEAIAWLKSAADDGYPCYPLFLTDPNLAKLRADPRFSEFMARLKQQWEHYQAVL